jgi:hypothetical protein
LCILYILYSQRYVDTGNMNTAHRTVEPHEDSTQWADPVHVTEDFVTHQ